MEWYGLTDKGRKRASNQDCFSVKIVGNALLAVVCDGMGGVDGGNIASEMACEYYTERLSDSIHSVDDPSLLTEDILKRFITNSVFKANFEVHRESQRKPALQGMGTTLVSCLIYQDKVLIANVGDSRLYQITNSEVCQITKDHSLVQTLLDSGAINESQANNHPNKNIITRAIGVDHEVECDLYTQALSSGYLLLCSDGLSNYIKNDHLMAIVNAEDTLQAKCEALISYANECGGVDNITAVLIQI